MKKLVSLFLALGILMGGMPIIQAGAAEEVPNQKAIDLVTGLGLMTADEEEGFQPDSTVARSETAIIIERIYRFDEEKAEDIWEFYGTTENVLLTPEAGGQSSVFADVTPGNPAYNAIAFAAMQGIMVGTGPDRFEPERELTNQEALNVLVNLLGYKVQAQMQGGYPNGYLQTAAQIGLVTGSPEEPITKGKLAALLAKTLDSDLMQTSIVNGGIHYAVVQDCTVLSEIMGITKITGQIKQNGVTSLTGESDLAPEGLQVENTRLLTTEQTAYAAEWIGRNVDCYYKSQDTEDEYTVVYCALSEKDASVTFPIGDFISYDGTKITYETETKNISKPILNGAYVIYNGLAMGELPSTYFDYEDGTVTLVASDNGSQYDIVIINGYENWYVSSVDTTDADSVILTNKIKDSRPDTDDVQLALPYEDFGKTISIVDKNGAAMELDQLTPNMAVDVSRNGNVIRLRVSEDRINDFKIQSIDTEEGILSDGELEYKLSQDFLDCTEREQYQVGQTYTLCLNSFDRIVWMEGAGTDDSVRFGYVMNFKNYEEEEKIVAKICTADKTFQNFYLADKIKLSDNRGNDNKRVEALNVFGILREFDNSVIRYKLNSEDVITEIELPLDPDVKTNKLDRLYTMVISDESNKANYSYSQNQYTFGAKVFISAAGTQVLSVPADITDQSKYRFISPDDITNGEWNFKAYGTNKRSVLAKFLCLSGSVSTALGDQNYPVVVTDVDTLLDENDEIVTKISIFRQGKDGVIYDSAENDFVHKALPRTLNQNTAAEDDYLTISPGDIIRVATDSSGYISFVEMLFDADAVYDNSKYSDYFEGRDSFDEDFTWKQTGMLAGTVGYYANDIQNTNPLASQLVGVTSSNLANRFDYGVPRFILGYVYDMQDGYITYTTQNIMESSYDPDNSKYVTESRNMDFVTTLVDLSGRTVTARTGTANDIRTYQDFPKSCSRVLVMTASADKRFMFIINGEIK